MREDVIGYVYGSVLIREIIILDRGDD